MAVVLGSSTNLASGTGTRSWTSPTTASKAYGVVVISGGGVDETSGVTWGGAAMARIATGASVTGESGSTSVWFIDAPGTGGQTVEITRSGSSAYIATAYDGTSATGHAEVVPGGQNVGWDIGDSNNISTITTSLTIPNGLVVALYGGLYSGENALGSITDNAALTRDHSEDFGNFVSVINRKTTLLTGTGAAYTSFAWTQSSDDGAWAVIAVREAAALTTVPGSFTANAVIKANSGTKTLTADAVIRKTQAFGANYDAVVLADNPTYGYWKLNESSGLPQDSSGSGNHVDTTWGSPEYAQAGLLVGESETSILYNQDAHSIPDTAFQPGDGPWSLELWIKRADLDAQTFYWFWGNRPGSGDGWIVGFNAAGQLFFYYYDGASNGTIFQSTQTFEDTDVHYIVLSKNGSTTTAYADGSALTNAGGTDRTLLSSYPNDWAIGAPGPQIAPTSSARSYVEKVAFYDAVLSTAQKDAHYAAGTGGGDGGGLTADAVIRRTQTGSFTADAVIKRTQTGSFTASAVIVREVFRDTFTRTVADGIGVSDSGHAWQRVGGTLPVSVDGSELAVGAGIDLGDFVGVPTPKSGLLTVDYHAGDSFVYADVYADLNLVGDYIQIVENGPPNKIWVYSSLGTLLGPTWVAGHIYRIKVFVTDDGSIFRIKVWDLVDSEPDWASEGPSGRSGTVPDPLWSFYSNNAIQGYGVDNIVWLATELPATVWHSATADAVIVVGATTVPSDFTADAVIKRTQTGSFTADAVIKRTQSGSLTADAVIRRTQAASLTADAVVRATQSGSFAADAFIRQTVSGSLTVDAVIKGTRSATIPTDAIQLRTYWFGSQEAGF